MHTKPVEDTGNHKSDGYDCERRDLGILRHIRRYFIQTPSHLKLRKPWHTTYERSWTASTSCHRENINIYGHPLLFEYMRNMAQGYASWRVCVIMGTSALAYAPKKRKPHRWATGCETLRIHGRMNEQRRCWCVLLCARHAHTSLRRSTITLLPTCTSTEFVVSVLRCARDANFDNLPWSYQCLQKYHQSVFMAIRSHAFLFRGNERLFTTTILHAWYNSLSVSITRANQSITCVHANACTF